MRIRQLFAFAAPAVPVAFTVALTAGWAPARAKHVTYIKPILQSIPAAGLTQVVVQNLVGPISIAIKAGDEVKLEALVHTGGDDDAFTHALADELKLEVTPANGQLRVIAHYPTDHFQNYGYPNMKSIAFIHGTDSNEYEGKKVYIRAVGSNKATELWTEIRLTAPPGLGVVIRDIYGDVTVSGDNKPVDSAFDGFTDVGDFSITDPGWANMKLESDYGKVEFKDGLGAARDIHVKTDVGGTYLDLAPGATGQIIASKDLGFLHNDFTDSHFSKNSDGESVMSLGDGHGTVVHIDMSVGSLHLRRIGDTP
jgi:hypothetical protein